MQSKILSIVFGLGFAFLSFATFASPGDELQLAEVIESTRLHYPKIREQYFKIEKAKAKVLKNQGTFDPKLSAQGLTSHGYYDNKSLDLKLEQATPLWGLTLFGGWRVSDGNFPFYDEMLNTTNAGEVYGGIKLPLLRDGFVDDARTEIALSKLELEQTKLTFLIHELLFSYEATCQYWKWFIEGQKYKMYQQLLKIAEVRQQAIQQKILVGSKPEIDRFDNQQFVANRQALVVEAEQNFVESSFKLSLFYRDAQGDPVIPSIEALPNFAKVMGSIPKQAPSDQELEKALANLQEHPLLKIDQLEIDQAESKLKLAKNQLLPQLDLSLKIANDLGDGGPKEINTQELKTGLSLKVPVFNRKARGDRRAANAELQQKRVQFQFSFEKIKNNLANTLQKQRRTLERLGLSKHQWMLAEKMEEAERSKFDLGYSDLLSVNLREEYAAKARISYLEALLSYKVSEAEYYFSLARFPL